VFGAVAVVAIWACADRFAFNRHVPPGSLESAISQSSPSIAFQAPHELTTERDRLSRRATYVGVLAVVSLFVRWTMLPSENEPEIDTYLGLLAISAETFALAGLGLVLLDHAVQGNSGKSAILRACVIGLIAMATASAATISPGRATVPD